jgi:hypothetical protein
MELKNKHVFWEALILAIFIFAIGIFLGYLLEKNRTANIISTYENSELNFLDINIQNDILSLDKIDCKQATTQMINFANQVYDEAYTLGKYEASNQITRGIILQHKKYDLLRTILWANTIKIKQKCGGNLSTLVYFYEYAPEGFEIKSQQDVFSKKLTEIKQELGDNVVLIPIAGNLIIRLIINSFL